MKVLRSPTRQTHPQASDVVSAHIITSLLDEIQKPSKDDVQRDCNSLGGFPDATLGHKRDTLLA